MVCLQGSMTSSDLVYSVLLYVHGYIPFLFIVLVIVCVPLLGGICLVYCSIYSFVTLSPVTGFRCPR